MSDDESDCFEIEERPVVTRTVTDAQSPVQDDDDDSYYEPERDITPVQEQLSPAMKKIADLKALYLAGSPSSQK